LTIFILGGINTWKFLCQQKMYYFENKLVWHLIYEDDAYSWY
jgi:hypothetical protein